MRIHGTEKVYGMALERERGREREHAAGQRRIA